MSNNLVFNSFMNLLLTKEVGSNETRKSVIYDSNKFDIWLCSKGKSFFANNDLNTKLGDYFVNGTDDKHDITFLYNLGMLKLTNVNSEDELPSEKTYQELLDIPASAYIFAASQYPKNCSIFKDYNYENFNYNVADGSVLYPLDKNTLYPRNEYDITKLSNYDSSFKANWENINEYFDAEYNFSTGYNPGEYATYNIIDKPLIEDQINVYSDNVSFNIQPSNTIGGALMITWYDGDRETLYSNGGHLTTASGNSVKNEKYDLIYKNIPTTTANCIPVCYMELPKNYNLKDMTLNIQWSENGLFSLV